MFTDPDWKLQADAHVSSGSELSVGTIDFAQRMFGAARTGDAELLVAAVEAGLPVNLTNTQGIISISILTAWLNCRCDRGNTLLMLAAYAGHLELTKALLQHGADPNRLNDLGQSIIAGAVFKTHDDIVRVLAENGADPRLGRTNAIEIAHMFGRKGVMEVLGYKEGDIGPEVPTPPSVIGQ